MRRVGRKVYLLDNLRDLSRGDRSRVEGRRIVARVAPLLARIVVEVFAAGLVDVRNHALGLLGVDAVFGHGPLGLVGHVGKQEEVDCVWGVP